ncbi:hypothetical protein pb186bvf_014890 [Paramecium bursaria]
MIVCKQKKTIIVSCKGLLIVLIVTNTMFSFQFMIIYFRQVTINQVITANEKILIMIAFGFNLAIKYLLKLSQNILFFYNFEKEIEQKVHYKKVKKIVRLQSNEFIIRFAIIFKKRIKKCKIEMDNLTIRITKSLNYKNYIGQFDKLNKKLFIFYVYSYGQQIHYSCNSNKILMRCRQNNFLQNLRKFKLQFIEFKYFVELFKEQASYIIQVYSKVDFLREYFNLNITTAHLIQNLKVRNNLVTLQHCFYDTPICVVDLKFFHTRKGVANWFKLTIEDQLNDIIMINDNIILLVDRKQLLSFCHQ